MIRLRLYSSAEPSRQIDQRMIGEDPVTIGRDASADWVINDPGRALSRRHCTVHAAGSAIAVRDTSANGTYLGDAAERIAPNEATMVNPGASIRIGTFTLLVEALAADAAPPPDPAVRSGPSMFAPPAGLEPSRPASAPARLDPFASKLVADPLLADHRPSDRVSLGDGDAWDRRPAARAGDWDLPRDRPDHDKLIGAPRDWAESPPVERDAGFGFDAPFDRPGMAPPPPTPAGAIPADWETAAPAPPPSPPSTTGPPTSEPAAASPPAPSPPLVPPPLAAVIAPPLVPPPPVDVAPAPSVSPPHADAPTPVVTQPASARPPLAPAPASAAASTSVPAAPPPAAPPPAAPPPAAPPPAAPPPAAPTVAENDDLFDAFCAGAGLVPTSFAPADRAAAMLRLGEVYRGMVLGLADLMGERAALKSEYRLSRTMIRPDRNNPFKWAPPQRLALEVLRGGDLGFADGAEAVAESFRDVKAHVLGVLAGMRGAVASTTAALSPATVEAAAEGRSFLIKAQRDAALWADYVERFGRFKAEAEDSADGAVNRAFRAAYEKQLAELDAGAVGSADGQSGPR